jgi:hypothetical protein
MASQNRFASAILRALCAGIVELGVTGDMIGVRGGVTSPADDCGTTVVVETDTVAITWFNKTPLHLLYKASPTYKS